MLKLLKGLPLISADRWYYRVFSERGFRYHFLHGWGQISSLIQGRHTFKEENMAQLTLDLDLPNDIEICGYERFEDGHGIEVKWPLPQRCRCQRCGREDDAHIEFKATVQVIRDLPLWEQPSFFVYQPPFHRCAYCSYRQDIIPPFKRKDVKYTYRFEEYVLQLLIGSNEEEVARRVGLSAETVVRIVENQISAAKPIDPNLKITDVGLDELSLKKRHKLYAALLTDLSDPQQPRILAVVKGKDQAAGEACLDRLSPEQQAAVRTHRVDMGPAFNAACASRLKNSRPVVDRFHVAKRFNDVVDDLRKKNHEGLQGQAEQGGTESVPGLDVGVPT
jgi:transposase